jgi:phosphomannomutase
MPISQDYNKSKKLSPSCRLPGIRATARPEKYSLNSSPGCRGGIISSTSAIDGNFPAHHPDPAVPDNLMQLRALVTAQGCDLGIAFDGDGDRIGVVDSRGRIIWPDQLMAFLARDVLRCCPGAPIIADVKSSQVLFDEIARLGGRPIMLPAGHADQKSTDGMEFPPRG